MHAELWEFASFKRLSQQGAFVKAMTDGLDQAGLDDPRCHRYGAGLMPADPRLLLRDPHGSGLYFVRVTTARQAPFISDAVMDGPYLLLVEAIAEARQAMAACRDGSVEILMGRGTTASVLVRDKEILQLAVRLEGA